MAATQLQRLVNDAEENLRDLAAYAEQLEAERDEALDAVSELEGQVSQLESELEECQQELEG